MTSPSNDILTKLAEDPTVKSLAQIAAPLMPVLARLAYETAVAAIQSITSDDPRLGLEILRENSSDAEWTAISSSLAQAGNEAVLKRLQDEAELKAALWKLALAGLTALVIPAVLP